MLKEVEPSFMAQYVLKFHKYFTYTLLIFLNIYLFGCTRLSCSTWDLQFLLQHAEFLVATGRLLVQLVASSSPTRD